VSVVRLVVILMLSWSAASALGAEDHFVCTIKVEYDLSRQGQLEVAAMSRYSAGQRFVVDRLTGTVRGKFVSTAGANNLVVVDRGSSENSYKAYWTHPRLASSPVAYLEIRTYRGPKPDFLLVNNAGIYTGNCD
jgi:hypothetical protein